MARTTDAILEQMKYTATVAVPELSPLENDNTSKTQVYRWLKYAIAFWTRLIELSFDAFKVETEDFVATYRPYSAAWYVGKLKAFQMGDAVLTTDTDVTYAVVDPDKQIIAQCSIEEVSQPGIDLVVKAVKRDPTTGFLMPLNVNEIAALNSYFRLFKPAGVRSVIRSEPGNALDIRLDIRCQGSVFDAQGAVLGTGARPVEKAMGTFFQTMPFNGTFYLHDLETYIINNVPGVISANVNFVAFLDSAGHQIPVKSSITPPSGYIIPPGAILNDYELV